MQTHDLGARRASRSQMLSLSFFWRSGSATRVALPSVMYIANTQTTNGQRQAEARREPQFRQAVRQEAVGLQKERRGEKMYVCM